jgi:peptide/nickel transport system substrate-binding protein
MSPFTFCKMRNLFLFFLVAGSAILLTNCGGGKNAESVVNGRLTSEPNSLNPLLTFDANAIQITGLMFQSMMSYDPVTLIEEPVLAKDRPKMTKIDTGALKGLVRFDYEIKDNAKWENGTPITGNDFLFSIKAVRNPLVKADVARGYIEHIKDIQVNAANPKKFSVVTSSYILSENSCNSIPVMPQYNYDAKNQLGSYTLAQLSDTTKIKTLAADTVLIAFAELFGSADLGRTPAGIVGSGPYKLVEWTSGQQLVLERKKDWWADTEKGALFEARPMRLIYKIIKDAAAAVNELKNGQLDVVNRLSPQMFTEMRNDLLMKDKFKFIESPSLEVSYLGLNMRSSQLTDVRVRKALAHLTDVNGIIKTAFLGLAKPTAGPIHNSKPYYLDVLPPAFNPALAMALLDSAGWKDTDRNGVREKTIAGKKNELRLRFTVAAPNEVGKNIGLQLQEEARKAGIVIELIPIEPERYREVLGKREFDLFVASMATDLAVDDPQQYWHTKSNSPSGGNRFGFGDAASDKLITDLRGTLDMPARDSLYKVFQKMVYEQQPAVFLCSPLERIVTSNKVTFTPTLRYPGYLIASAKF